MSEDYMKNKFKEDWYCPLCRKDGRIVLIRKKTNGEKIVDFKCSVTDRCVVIPISVMAIEKLWEIMEK